MVIRDINPDTSTCLLAFLQGRVSPPFLYCRYSPQRETHLANSMTAACIPKQIPRKGTWDSLFALAAETGIREYLRHCSKHQTNSVVTNSPNKWNNTSASTSAQLIASPPPTSKVLVRQLFAYWRERLLQKNQHHLADLTSIISQYFNPRYYCKEHPLPRSKFFLCLYKLGTVLKNCKDDPRPPT